MDLHKEIANTETARVKDEAARLQAEDDLQAAEAARQIADDAKSDLSLCVHAQNNSIQRLKEVIAELQHENANSETARVKDAAALEAAQDDLQEASAARHRAEDALQAAQDDLQSAEAAQYEAESQLDIIVCMHGPREITPEPCGHFVLCSHPACQVRDHQGVFSCPVCKTVNTGHRRTYM